MVSFLGPKTFDSVSWNLSHGFGRLDLAKETRTDNIWIGWIAFEVSAHKIRICALRKLRSHTHLIE